MCRQNWMRLGNVALSTVCVLTAFLLTIPPLYVRFDRAILSPGERAIVYFSDGMESPFAGRMIGVVVDVTDESVTLRSDIGEIATLPRQNVVETDVDETAE